MHRYSLLLVEDDQELADLTAAFFDKYEFDCHIENSGTRAIEHAIAQQPDLMILDLMLPDMDGMEVCRKVAGKFQGKLIMLTARTDTYDQVVGLELGADDYITKPVEPRLLLAKARAVLRRESVQESNHPQSAPAASVPQAHPLSIDKQRREVSKSGALIALTNPEYDLLVLLHNASGRIVSRDEIFQSLRGVEYDGQNRQVDILISHLRAKLEDDPTTPTLIKTIRNKGYLFCLTAGE